MARGIESWQQAAAMAAQSSVRACRTSNSLGQITGTIAMVLDIAHPAMTATAAAGNVFAASMTEKRKMPIAKSDKMTNRGNVIRALRKRCSPW